MMKQPWSFLLGPFQRRAAARLNISKEAAALIARDGDMAYYTAREFQRTFREAGKRDLTQYWGWVAQNIAHKQGKMMGETVADRYEKTRRGN